MANPGAVSIRDYVSAMTDRLTKKSKYTIGDFDKSSSGNTAADQEKTKKKKKKHKKHHRENFASRSECVDGESCETTNQSVCKLLESTGAVDECDGLVKVKKHKKRKLIDLDSDYREPDSVEVPADDENFPSKPKKHKKHRRKYTLQPDDVSDLAVDQASILPLDVASCSDLDEHVPDFIDKKIKRKKRREGKLAVEREHTIQITTPAFNKPDFQSNNPALLPNSSDKVIDNVLDRRKKRLKKRRRNTSEIDEEICSGSNPGQVDDLAGSPIIDEQITSAEGFDNVFSKQKAKKHRHNVLIKDQTVASESSPDLPNRSFCDSSRSYLKEDGVSGNVSEMHKKRIQNHCRVAQFNSGFGLVDSSVDAIEYNPVSNFENDFIEAGTKKPKHKKHRRRKFSTEEEQSISDPNLVDSNEPKLRTFNEENSIAQDVTDCVFKKKKHKKHRKHSPQLAAVDFDSGTTENGATLRTSEILDQSGASELSDNNTQRSRPSFLLENDKNVKSAVHPGLLFKSVELESPKKRTKRRDNDSHDNCFQNFDQTKWPPELAAIQEPDELELSRNRNHECGDDFQQVYKLVGGKRSASQKMKFETFGLVNQDETETYPWFKRSLDSCPPVDDWTQLTFMKKSRDPPSFATWRGLPDQQLTALIQDRWESYRRSNQLTDEYSEECLKTLCCNFPPGLNRPFEHFPSSELDRVDFALQIADTLVPYNDPAQLAEFLSRICTILTNSPFGVHYPVRYLSREISLLEWVKKLNHELPPPVHLPIDGKGFKTARELEAYLSVATKIDRTNCHVYCPTGLHAVLKKNINNERDRFCKVLDKYGIPNLIGGQFTARERAQVYVNWQRFCDKHKDELDYFVQNGRMNPKIFTMDNRTFFHQLAAGFPNRFPFLLYDNFNKMRKQICEDNGSGLTKRPLEHVECDVKRKKRVVRLTTPLTIQLCETIMELSGKTLTEWCSKTYDPPGRRLLHYHNKFCQCGYQSNKFVDYGQVTRLCNERMKYNKPFSEEYLGHRCVVTVRARLIQLHPDRVIPDNYEEELWNPVVRTMDAYSIILFLERLLEFPEVLSTGNMQWDQVRDAFLTKDYFPVLVRNKSKCELLWRMLQRRAKIPPNFGRRTMLEIATEAKNYYVRRLQNQ